MVVAQGGSSGSVGLAPRWHDSAARRHSGARVPEPRPGRRVQASLPRRVSPTPAVSSPWLVAGLVDGRQLHEITLERGRRVLLDTYHDDARVRAEPFEVFELELDVLWAGVQLAEPPR
jgi:hypothetical protein